MTYTLVLRNNSAVPAEASLADPIPLHTTYIPGSAVASNGTTPAMMDREIHWAGRIVPGTPIIIEYVVQVEDVEGLQHGHAITNVARLEDGLGNTILLGADALYRPEAGLSIEDGASYTNIPTVTLRLWTSQSLPQMEISNSSGFATGTGWIEADTTRAWVLDTKDHLLAPHTVYAMFRAENGEQYGPLQDDIIYDPIPPLVTEIEIVDDAASGQSTAGEITTVRVGASDDTSGVSKVQVSDDPAFETYSLFTMVADTIDIQMPWELQATDQVFVRAVDRAGNLSAIRSWQRHTVAVYLPLFINCSPE
jgi:uncharacterized repeat protein (TIGR01451 family)